MLVDLDEALRYAWALPRFEAGDFAAALVRAWKQEGGGNIYIDGSPRKWEMLHGDVEWVYVIRSRKAKVHHGLRLTDRVGEPVVEVYDWHDYWLEKADPHQDAPQPACTLGLLEAEKAGRRWRGKRGIR